MRPNKNIGFASPFGIMLNEHNADHGVPAQTDGDSTLLRVIMESLYNGKLGASGGCCKLGEPTNVTAIAMPQHTPVDIGWQGAHPLSSSQLHFSSLHARQEAIGGGVAEQLRFIADTVWLLVCRRTGGGHPPNSEA